MSTEQLEAILNDAKRLVQKLTEVLHNPPSRPFAVGDHVRHRASSSVYAPDIGAVGIVRDIASYRDVGVEWIGFTKGHSLNGILSKNPCVSSAGWYVAPENMERI